MKSTGIVRKVDELGRVVLPMKLRKSMNIEQGTPMEIFVDGEKIILSKYDDRVSCVFCGETEKLNYFFKRAICPSCAQFIRNNIYDVRRDKR